MNSISPAYNTQSRAKAAMFAAIAHRQCMYPKHLSSCRFPSNTINAVLDNEDGEQMGYRHLMKKPKYRNLYGKSYAKEIGWLAQGMPGQVTGTNTIIFINKKDVPADRWRDVTYGRVVVNFRPEKEDPYRTRLTVGGDRVNYPYNFGTPTVDLATEKYLLNSVISTPLAKFTTIDIKNFYLCTLMTRFIYM